MLSFINCVAQSEVIKDSAVPSPFLTTLKSWQMKFQRLFTLPTAANGLSSSNAASTFINKPLTVSTNNKALNSILKNKLNGNVAENESQTKLRIETHFESLLEFSQEENDPLFLREKVKTSVIMPNYSIKDVHSIQANSIEDANASPSYTFQRICASSFKSEGVKYCRLPDGTDLSYLTGWEVHVQEFGIGIVQLAEIVNDNNGGAAPLSKDGVLSMFLTVTFHCNMTRRVRVQLVDQQATPSEHYSYNNAPRPKMNVTFLQKLYYI